MTCPSVRGQFPMLVAMPAPRPTSQPSSSFPFAGTGRAALFEKLLDWLKDISSPESMAFPTLYPIKVDNQKIWFPVNLPLNQSNDFHSCDLLVCEIWLWGHLG